MEAARWLSGLLGKPAPAALTRAGSFPSARPVPQAA
jgi:hypothetical protein